MLALYHVHCTGLSFSSPVSFVGIAPVGAEGMDGVAEGKGEGRGEG